MLSILIRDIEMRKAQLVETVAEINQHTVRKQFLNSELISIARKICTLKNILPNLKEELSGITRRLESFKNEEDRFKHLNRDSYRKTF